MLKVANVIMEGRFGGPHARISSVAERLKKDGIETIVVFPKKDSDHFYKKLIEKHIKHRRLSLHRLTKQKSHLIKFILLFVPELLLLCRLFKKEGVNIVHCNGAWQIKGFIAGKLTGSKIVWHLNDTYMPPVIHSVFNFLAFYYCDYFITAGERVKNYYLSDRKKKKKEIIEIQAPVDTAYFNPDKVDENPNIARCSGLKIITISNINPIKGIEYFIEMADKLNKKYDGLNFFVVGPIFNSQEKYSEKLFKMVEQLKLKNLYFYGASNNIASVLKAANIYVCPSIQEASPISLWEAMAMNKPIVSTDVGDVKRFIKDGENGFIVKEKDSSALAEKVGTLIENKELSRAFAEKVREVALNYLDLDICTNKHAMFYKKMMGLS